MSYGQAQWDILRGFATERVMDLVKRRLLHGLRFFEKGMRVPEFSRDEIKLALLIVRISNPTEVFTADERAYMDNPNRSHGQQEDASPAGESVSSAGENTSPKHSAKKAGHSPSHATRRSRQGNR